MSPPIIGSSIGFTKAAARERPSATERGASCRAASSSRSTAAGFSAAMLNVSTRSPETAATARRSLRKTTASRTELSFSGFVNFMRRD